MCPAEDSYGPLGYRQMIDWKGRLAREVPFLERQLTSAPAHRLLDLGCGSGEHAAHFAAEGWTVLGVDHSQAQIDAARSHVHPDLRLRFLHGAFSDLDALREQGVQYGAALCLGNVLPSLEDDELLDSLGPIRQSLLPSAPLIVQLLNFERIFSQSIRHLPLNFRPGTRGEELLFLRLLRPDPPRHVLFQPLRLRLDPGPAAEVSLEHVGHVRWRGWTAAELLPLLRRAGFEEIGRFGDMRGNPFDARDSHDLVLCLRAEK